MARFSFLVKLQGMTPFQVVSMGETFEIAEKNLQSAIRYQFPKGTTYEKV